MTAVSTHVIDEEVQRLRAILPKDIPIPEEHRHAGRGRFTVLCRFRYAFGEELAWDLTERAVAERAAPGASQSFTFDKVFSPEASQQSVYESVEHIIQGVMSGVNGAILCYGQTSAGKTFTMEGPPDCTGGEHVGIIPRVLASLFHQVPEVEAEDCTAGYRVHLSMLEIYMERLRDLLVDGQGEASSLHIVTNRSGLVHVQGLSSMIVGSLEAAMAVFRCGQSRRVVSATNMNCRSSRSHCIFMVHISSRHSSSKLCLADLAGSENLKKAHFKDDAAANVLMSEEAKGINKSLATLSSVIQRLSSGREEHVPFRDSKLTRVLQDVISGRCRSALIINCSGALRHSGETLSSLRFGACAQRIASLPVVPDSRAAVLLKTLHTAREEIEQLRAQFLHGHSHSHSHSHSHRQNDRDRHGLGRGQGQGQGQGQCQGQGMQPEEPQVQQWTPRTLKRCTADELSPLRFSQLTPSKRWDVGRSSSPLSGFTASSRSPSCSRSASLSSARYAAALQRNGGKAAWLPRSPPWPTRQVPRLQPVSPLSLSPGPSARPTPRTHVLSQATPLTPEASELACSVVECSTNGALGREVLRPQGAYSWEWPLTRRQQLEREVQATMGQLTHLQHLRDAEEDWLAWLETGRVPGLLQPQTAGVRPQFLAETLPKLGMAARPGSCLGADAKQAPVPTASSLRMAAAVGTEVALGTTEGTLGIAAALDSNDGLGLSTIATPCTAASPRTTDLLGSGYVAGQALSKPVLAAGQVLEAEAGQGKPSTRSEDIGQAPPAELLDSVLQAWHKVVTSAPPKQTQLCVWIPSPWQQGQVLTLLTVWVDLMRSCRQLLAQQGTRTSSTECHHTVPVEPADQRDGLLTEPTGEEAPLAVGLPATSTHCSRARSTELLRSVLQAWNKVPRPGTGQGRLCSDHSSRAKTALLLDSMLRAWYEEVAVSAPLKQAQLRVWIPSPWQHKHALDFCRAWLHLMRSWRQSPAQQEPRPSPRWQSQTEPQESAGQQTQLHPKSPVQEEVIAPSAGQDKVSLFIDRSSRRQLAEVLGSLLSAWHKAAVSPSPMPTQLCVPIPNPWQRGCLHELGSAWAELIRSGRQLLARQEPRPLPHGPRCIEPIEPARQQEGLLEQPDAQEEALEPSSQGPGKLSTGSNCSCWVWPAELLGSVLHAWLKAAALAPPKQTELCLRKPILWQQGPVHALSDAWVHLMRSSKQLLAQQEASGLHAGCHHTRPDKSAGQPVGLPAQPARQQEADAGERQWTQQRVLEKEFSSAAIEQRQALLISKLGPARSSKLEFHCSTVYRSLARSMGAAAVMLLSAEAAWLCGPDTQRFF